MEFITDNFELLTKTPDSINQLKQLVLDLAVRGLLVPQIEEEGDGSVIIQRSNDLEYNVNHSRKRKKKISAPISNDEAPFDIPTNWKWIRLGEVFNTTSGGTPTRGVPEYWNGEIPWLKSGELNDSIITDSPSEYITQEGLNKSSAKLFPKGSLVIALYGATAGKLGILDYETTSNQAICAFFENPYISTEYLFFYLLAYRSKIVQDSWGQAQPNISQTYLKKFPFALPPKQEQHRIVQKVNTLFQQIDHLADSSDQAEHTRERLRRVLLHRLEQAPTQLESGNAWLPLQDQFDLAIRTVEDVQALRQTILQLAVKGQLVPQDPQDEHASVLLERIKMEKDRLVKEGKIRKQKPLSPISAEEVPFEVPEGWVWCKLQQIADAIDPNPSHRMPKYTEVEDSIPFLSTQNIVGKEEMDFSIGKRTSVKLLEEHINRYEVKKGTFVLSRIGTIGKTCFLPLERNYCLSHVFSVINTYTDDVLPSYLELCVSSELVLSQALEGTQSTGVPDLGMGKIRSFLIPLPPLNEQKRIVAKVEQLLGWCNELETKIKEKTEKEEVLVKVALSLA